LALFINYSAYIILPILYKDESDIFTVKYYNYVPVDDTMTGNKIKSDTTGDHCKNRIIERTERIEKVNETNSTKIKPQLHATEKNTEFIYDTFIYDTFPYIFTILLYTFYYTTIY